MDYAKKLKLKFHVVDLYLPERGIRYSSSREEEHVPTKIFQCGPQTESRTHIITACEMYK